MRHVTGVYCNFALDCESSGRLIFLFCQRISYACSFNQRLRMSVTGRTNDDWSFQFVSSDCCAVCKPKKSTCTIKPATHPQKTISHDCSNLANRTWLPLSWEWFVYAVFMQKSLRWCCIRSGRYRTPTSLPLLHPSPPAPWSMFSRILIMKAAHGV